ncbi:hypothetical protein GF324_09375 [bacterium]|nr:hypothetical protein [bacterium]
MSEVVRQQVFPSRRDELPRIAEFVRAFVLAAGGSVDHARRLELAVDEAVTNIIEYAYESIEEEIHIRAEIQDNELCITLEDRGVPFDPTQAGPPLSMNQENPHQHLGLGIPIIRHFADTLSYRRTASGWNSLRICRMIS